ncbi:MAG: 4'-phosphopantetheinyl transferase [Pseudonocardiales bacterium]|nr:MAG: 4'-phosphopantetheinyl transferase [Pseudonocardiales bacterium]
MGLREIVPGWVEVAESFGDLPYAPLFADERAQIARAVLSRRAEFATTRHCARRALSQLGCPPQSIPVRDQGMPGWPNGYSGSLTHCKGYRAAAVSRSTYATAIGIDAEPAEALPPEIVDAVATPVERESLAHLRRRHPAVPWDRVMFSAKESVYKAWYAITHRWLGHHDVCLRLDAARGRFCVTFGVVALPVAGVTIRREMTGRWHIENQLIFTTFVARSRLQAGANDSRPKRHILHPLRA